MRSVDTQWISASCMRRLTVNFLPFQFTWEFMCQTLGNCVNKYISKAYKRGTSTRLFSKKTVSCARRLASVLEDATFSGYHCTSFVFTANWPNPIRTGAARPRSSCKAWIGDNRLIQLPLYFGRHCKAPPDIENIIYRGRMDWLGQWIATHCQ